MAKTSAVNATAAGAWQYGNAAGDAFAKEDVQNLGANFDGHNHASTKGLPVNLATASAVLAADVTSAASQNPLVTLSGLVATATYLLVASVEFLDNSAASNNAQVLLADGAGTVIAAQQPTAPASKYGVATVTAIYTLPGGVTSVKIVGTPGANATWKRVDASGTGFSTYIHAARIG